MINGFSLSATWQKTTVLTTNILAITVLWRWVLVTLIPIIATILAAMVVPSVQAATDESPAYGVHSVDTIVALSPHSVEMLFEIGLGDKITATVDYADYPQAAKQIRRIGRSNFIDIEALLLLNPDLIVLSFEDTSTPLLEQLKQLNFPMFDTSVVKLDDIADRLQALGDVTGHSEVGLQKAQVFRAELAKLREQYQGRSPVKLFYQIWPEPLTTVSGGWMDGILSDCGGSNIFANGLAAYPQVSMEQVLVRMPELILKPLYHGNANQELMDWGTWHEIPAVRNQAIITMQGDLINRAGPRVLQGMEKVCQIIDNVRKMQAGS
jgi:vitamin B12 transport system substrate-binding protein